MRQDYQAKANALIAIAISGLAVLAHGNSHEGLKPLASSSSASCREEFNHRDLGCYVAAENPFAWRPPDSNPDPDGAHWITGTRWNETATPRACNAVCRAHGFRYAAVWGGGECSCGSALQPGMWSNGDAEARRHDAECAGAEGCPGDRLEACGTQSRARIFVDPSFGDGEVGVEGYGYLACFANPNFFGSDFDSPNPAACFAHCAGRGMPFVFMRRMDGEDGGKVRCSCGQEFGSGAWEVTPPADGSCAISCEGNIDTAEYHHQSCESQNCCGTTDGPYPVYANPDLMGCHVPQIPGKLGPKYADNLLTRDVYECFATPASILGHKPTVAVVHTKGPTITRAATFQATATASVSVHEDFVYTGEWVLYGCYGDDDRVDQTLGKGYIAAPDETWSTDSPDPNLLTPDGCVSYCAAQFRELAGGTVGPYDYAALSGAGELQRCYCASAVGEDAGAGSRGPSPMRDCNQPCRGDDTLMCGHPNGPLVYARAAVADTGAYVQGKKSYEAIPAYSCTSTGVPSRTATAGSTLHSTTSTGMSSNGASMTSTGVPDAMNAIPFGLRIEGSPLSTSTPTPPATSVSSTAIVDLIRDMKNKLKHELDWLMNKPRDMPQRQDITGNRFLVAGGSTTTSCTDATAFLLKYGVLRAGGAVVAADHDPAVPFSEFRTGEGFISRTFSVVNNLLHWYNDAFMGGVAGFCVVPSSGRVFATFGAPANVPAGCEPVQLVVYPISQCVNGKIISSETSRDVFTRLVAHVFPQPQLPIPILLTPSTYSIDAPPAPDDVIHVQGDVGGIFLNSLDHHANEGQKKTDQDPKVAGVGSDRVNGESGDSIDVPSEEGIYPMDSSPTGVECHPVVMSWIPGQSTFIRDEL